MTIGIGTGNVVGGSTPQLRNIISGNGRIGVLIEGAGATNNRVVGNFIGTDVNGTADLGNGFDGVFVSVSGNIIGGAAPAEGNVISGNGRAGIYLGGNVTGNNSVLSNFIGLDAHAVIPIPNATGVYLESAANTVGTTTAPNLISSNTGAGIDVRASGNHISGNRVELNGGLGQRSRRERVDRQRSRRRRHRRE